MELDKDCTAVRLLYTQLSGIRNARSSRTTSCATFAAAIRLGYRLSSQLGGCRVIPAEDWPRIVEHGLGFIEPIIVFTVLPLVDLPA